MLSSSPLFSGENFDLSFSLTNMPPAGREGRGAQRRRSAANGLTMQRLVEIWRILIEVSPRVLDAAGLVLDPQEMLLAERHRFAKDRDRFVARRAARRFILARLTGAAPDALRFAVGRYGKPALDGFDDILFSASHSASIALIAVAERAASIAAVGVDVERLRVLADVGALADRVLSPEERALVLKGGSIAAQTEGFLRHWTVKEAWLKAKGTGIGDDLRDLRVAFAANGDAVVRDGSDGIPHPVASFAPCAGYVAAAVGSARGVTPRCRDFSWSAVLPAGRRGSG